VFTSFFYGHLEEGECRQFADGRCGCPVPCGWRCRLGGLWGVRFECSPGLGFRWESSSPSSARWWPPEGASHFSLAKGWASRLGRGIDTPSPHSYAKYGAVYGLASLSCTLPAFLAVITTSLLSGGFVSALVQFVAFGTGMAALLAALTLLVGWLGSRAHEPLRRFSRHALRVSGVLLLLGGGYLVYYWLTYWVAVGGT
jgi:hypothetical protein